MRVFGIVVPKTIEFVLSTYGLHFGDTDEKKKTNSYC